MALDLEATVQCSKCSAETPESELLPIFTVWVCGKCYDEICYDEV
jgi:hypothetical protein